MSLSTQEIKEILSILEQSGWEEAQLTVGDMTLTVSKSSLERANGVLPAPGRVPAEPAAAGESPPEHSSGAGVPAPAPDASGAAASQTTPASREQPIGAAGGEDVGGVLATSPSIGVFWRSPEPGAAPFVELGATVSPGDTLCIVEVMKLMQQVVAEVAGTVTRVHAENGGEVEFGSPLFTIVPAGS